MEDGANRTFIIYGKNNCSYCEKAKVLLTAKKEKFEYLTLDEDYTREELLELVPDAKTVPQILLDDKDENETVYIGGYSQLEAYFEDPVKIALDEGLKINVVFTKVDGSDRTMFCTRNVEYIPKEKRATEPSDNSSNTIRVYDIEKQDWRSFRIENVKSFTVVEEEE